MGEVQSRQPAATPGAQTLEAELDRIAALGLDEVRALWPDCNRFWQALVQGSQLLTYIRLRYAA